MTDDIVTELDRYLVRDETVGFTEMVQRARDEIVALRARLDVLRQWKWSEATDLDIRHEALEEAARVCERADKSTHPASCADMIRALKEKH